VPTLDSIVTYLNAIAEAGNLLEQLTIDTYHHLNTRINNAINQITNLQTQLDTLQNDYDLLNQAYRAHKLNHHLLKATSIGNKKCITALLQEKFVSHLLNRRSQRQLQEYKADKGLLEYNRDRLYERYEKWKNKTYKERQNIFNLNQQNLLLQNTIANFQNMATL